MRGDERGAAPPRLAERVLDAVGDADEPLEPHGHGMRPEQRVGVVVRQLETRQDEHVVLHACARGLDLDGREVGVVVAGMDVRVPRAGARERIVGPHGVIGDAEHVEAGVAVGVDELADRLRAVAPGRVGVQLAQQEVVPEARHTPIFQHEAWSSSGPGGRHLETIW